MSQRNIETEIVADSINPAGKRITTALWTYPRFIHAEIMTHRMLSRNAASSRAIPLKKMLQAVDDQPAMPVYWGANQSVMQAAYELSGEEKLDAIEAWRKGRFAAMETAEFLATTGVHKQIANRVLEPWMRITVLVTATDWDNFFALRAHPDAQPEFQVLAYRFLAKMIHNTPKRIEWSDWHIPFDPGSDLHLDDRLAISVAKAARTSYVAFDADKTMEEQRTPHDNMRASGHMSPFEHQARANAAEPRSGNFTGGWEQYRHMLPNENRKVEDYAALLATKPDWVEL